MVTGGVAVIVVEEAQRDAFGHFNLLHLESAARADVYLAGGSALARRGLDGRRIVSLAGMDVPKLRAEAETMGLAAAWGEMEGLKE